MIILVRKATIAFGKLVEGMVLAKEMAELVSRLTDNEVKVLTSIGGNLSVGWLATYKDLASYEAASAKLTSNQEYLAAIKKTAGVFVDGSISDQIWRQV